MIDTAIEDAIWAETDAESVAIVRRALHRYEGLSLTEREEVVRRVERRLTQERGAPFWGLVCAGRSRDRR